MKSDVWRTIEKRLLECGELEIKIGFGDGFRGRPQSGQFRRLYVDVGIVVDAVLPGVVAGVDETIVTALLEEPLDGVRVLQVRGADEFIAWTPSSSQSAFHSAAISRRIRIRDAAFWRNARR